MSQNSKKPLWLNLVVILACILVFLGAWLYLSGAFYLQFSGGKFEDAQPLTFYQYWFHHRHLDYVYEDLQLAGGVAGFALAIPILLFVLPKKKKLHGDRKFATQMEIKRAGLFANIGLLVGKIAAKFGIYNGDKHIIVEAPTRSMKGVSFVVPNSITYPWSMFILDPKKEVWKLTSKYRKKYGHKVFFLNFSPRDYKSHCWDPLYYISEDPNFRIDDIQKIAAYIFPDVKGQDPIWTSSARSMFLGTVLYLSETPGKLVTLGEVLRTCTQNEEAGKFFKRVIMERYEAGNPYSAACNNALNDFIQTSENTRNSIRKTFSSRFEVLFNPVVDSVLSRNDFDLRNFRKEKMTVYMCVPPGDLERFSFLINLFIEQLLDLNMQELPESNRALKYQMCLLLDEFPSLGVVQKIKNSISVMAGYGIKLALIIQSAAQLRDLYGHDAADNMFANMGIQVAFAPAPQDHKRAAELSTMLGTQTWRSKSKGKSSGGKGSRSENQSDVARPLMLPQEISDMGIDKQFIFIEHTPPILCKKIRYYEEKVIVDRLKEMSPTLAEIGDRFPTFDELKNVMASGEMEAEVPTLVVITPEPPAPIFEKDSEKKEPSYKVLSPADMNKIDSYSLDDFSCDFSDIEIPSDPVSDDDLVKLKDAYLSKFGF
jgi:type IV secretion system protein VirD4